MEKKLVFAFIILISSLLGFSQSPTQDSIASKKTAVSPTRPIDSTFVTYNSYQFDSIFLNSSKVIDTLTFHTNDYEILEKRPVIFSTLSNTGLAHKSMRFNYMQQVGFDMTLPAFSAMLQNESTMVAYQSVLPYSELRYVMTVNDKEQHLNVKFGRRFARRLFVSFAFNTDYSPGVFKNCRSLNNYFWVNAHYFTKDNRYAVSAYWYRNKLVMDENGGLANDEDYTSNTESDNSVLNVNLNSATNTVVSSGVGLQHYFNLLPQKKLVSPAQNDSIQFPPVADSLLIDSLFIDTVNHQVAAQETKVRKFTLGRICHNFSYLSNKLYYNEASPYVAFYQPYDTLLNNSKTTDTTIVRAFRNTLQWNSLGYQKYNDDVPLYVYAGLTHGFYNVKRFDYQEGEMMLARNYQQLTVNGGVIVNLFKSAQIKGQAQLVTLGYQVGDFDIKAQWRQYLGTTRKNYGQVVFNFDIKRQSANWFEASYYSNHFRWDNEFKAATYLSFDLKYKFWDYCIGVRQTSIANFIYFDTDARPAQHEEMFSIREAYLSFYQKIWRFEVEGFASLQKASNEDVIHLPLVQASLKLGYSQPMFHKAATLLPSITVRYFTKYYADAYMPATRTFFLQNEVQIGNYPFIDVALAIKVKKAHIYAAYSNMMMLSKNHNSFIAPHYPMRDSKVFIGVNWRLFN